MNYENATNIILIGMPWSGKSTSGVLLAKALARPFIDTDVVIQSHEGCTLQEIIDQCGAAALQHLEERYVLALTCTHHIIATGGSIVYSHVAMTHLKRTGFCLYLKLPYRAVAARATHIDFRGLVREPGQSLEALYNQRAPLYHTYADAILDCEYLDQEQVLQSLLTLLNTAARANRTTTE